MVATLARPRARVVGSPGQSFSTELRERTQGAHRASEAAFDLERRVVSPQAYAQLLLLLRAFYGGCEHELGSVRGWDQLTPAIDVAARRRAFLIDADLASLSVSSASKAAAIPVLESLPRGLGCLYVLEGSALGGQLVARRVRAALGEGAPVAFFRSAGRSNLGADWRALQAALDAFGARADDADRRVALAAAQETFAALGRHLAGAEPAR